MLKRIAPLENDELLDVLERELEEGVHIDSAPEIEEHTEQRALGGLIAAEEDVSVRELK